MIPSIVVESYKMPSQEGWEWAEIKRGKFFPNFIDESIA